LINTREQLQQHVWRVLSGGSDESVELFFTPRSLTKLLARIASQGMTGVNAVYDPCCGSGGLLLQVKQVIGDVSDGFYGQDANASAVSVAMMNLFFNDVDVFDIQFGDTLTNPQFRVHAPFDVIVSAPPFSAKWVGVDHPELATDAPFVVNGVSPPRSHADFAFVLHALDYLSAGGRAVLLMHSAAMTRPGVESKIREYLVDANLIDAVITLPRLLTYASVDLCVLVLSKHKTDTAIHYINASDAYTKSFLGNTLSDEQIDHIVDVFAKRAVNKRARLFPFSDVIRNDYNLLLAS
jgi:type I restriction enzyme M protein